MGPQDPKDVSRDIARDLTELVGEIAALKGDATHWLKGSEYATLKHRLEYAHAAVEAAQAKVEVNKRKYPAALVKGRAGKYTEGVPTTSTRCM